MVVSATTRTTVRKNLTLDTLRRRFLSASLVLLCLTSLARNIAQVQVVLSTKERLEAYTQ